MKKLVITTALALMGLAPAMTMASPQSDLKDFRAYFFKKFPGVKAYLDGIRKSAAEDGYVETLLGRKRYFPQLKNPSTAQVKARAEREAINAPIQGTAADILKIAMIHMPAAIKKAENKSR